MKYFYDTEFHEDGKTIDLISIGIVAEDGREYHATNVSANWNRISRNKWLVENVIPHLPHPDLWKSKDQIADEVADFLLHDGNKVELWADYAAYDHVVLAQLFGTMMDLPSGVPMWSHDFQQLLEAKGIDGDDLPVFYTGQHNALTDARNLRSQWNMVQRGGAL